MEICHVLTLILIMFGKVLGHTDSLSGIEMQPDYSKGESVYWVNMPVKKASRLAKSKHNTLSSKSWWIYPWLVWVSGLSAGL